MARVLPMGAPFVDDPSFRSRGKTVSSPNAYARFSNRQLGRANVSSVLSNAAPPIAGCDNPRAGIRVAPKAKADPFDGTRADHWSNIPHRGVRQSGFEEIKSEEGRYRQDHPRLVRKSVSGPQTKTAEEERVTISANGVRFAKGKGQHAEARGKAESGEDGAAKAKPYPTMARFTYTPRESRQNVLLPETCNDYSPKRKEQRFNSTPHSASLVGVLVPDTNARQGTGYKVTPPWHTSE